MTPWTERTNRQCAYLVSKTEACCQAVTGGSAMADRYCPTHYEAMIDRDGMRRAKAKRGVFNRSVPARLRTGWDFGREGGRQ